MFVVVTVAMVIMLRDFGPKMIFMTIFVVITVGMVMLLRDLGS
jgi:hypothetical protein